MNDDALNNIKRLRDVLNEAIAAMESGREVKVEEKLPSEEAWHSVAFRDRKYRCTIKPRELWVNEYPGGATCWHDSRELADRCARDSRIRCTRYVEAINDD